MKSRRDFVKAVAAIGILSAPTTRAQKLAEALTSAQHHHDDRRYWLDIMERLGTPVLTHLSRRELRRRMPVETFGDQAKLRLYTHLEAISRLLVGIAPWLEVSGATGAEEKLRKRFADLARECLDAATDPKSPDFMNFSRGQQPLVDAAFLAQAILRAPQQLWIALDRRVQRQVIAALKSSRDIPPIANNHILFSAMVEAALLYMEEKTVEARLEGYLRQMLAWYRGDGAYSDGDYFRFDYYNSFVIHPMLVDILGVLKARDSRFQTACDVALQRSRRFAEVQERMIAPDGTYPPIGRSITYRFGAFQTLAQMALLKQLPPTLTPAQVRCALTAVIRRTIEAPGTFDSEGWLRVGLSGSQVSLGERYISTGSLYLCSVGLLPLGLPAEDPFWSDPPARWTSQRLWSGEALPADHALREEVKSIELPTLNRTP